MKRKKKEIKNWEESYMYGVNLSSKEVIQEDNVKSNKKAKGNKMKNSSDKILNPAFKEK